MNSEPDFDEIDEDELYQEDYDTWDGHDDDTGYDICSWCGGSGSEGAGTGEYCYHCNGTGFQ